MMPEKARILDLGCGPGRDAKIFADKGYTVMGIDLSEKMIAAARTMVKNAKFEVMDVAKLKFKDGSFDGVWANASPMHMPKADATKALKEAYRVLKKGGVFYLCVKEGSGQALLPDERYGGVEKFWSFYSKEYIEKAVENTGFAIIESYVTEKRNPYATHPWISVFARKR